MKSPLPQERAPWIHPERASFDKQLAQATAERDECLKRSQDLQDQIVASQDAIRSNSIAGDYSNYETLRRTAETAEVENARLSSNSNRVLFRIDNLRRSLTLLDELERRANVGHTSQSAA